MTIHVTLDDIEKGERGEVRSCPIARAVKRQSKSTGIFCGTETVGYTSHGKHYYAKLNAFSQMWIRKFDSGKKVGEFEFIIRFENDPEWVQDRWGKKYVDYNVEVK